jgi:lipopolysaccharide export system permease protein
MPLLERYVLRRLVHAFALALGVLVATLWVTQILRELDVVTAKGQTIWLFLFMTGLAIPSIIENIAPVAFLIATLVVVNLPNSDSERAVMACAGASRRVVARPVLAFAALLLAALAFIQHVAAPASMWSLRQLITQVRADLIAAMVRDGDFRSVQRGLTVHVRERAADGSFRGIFVSDERNPDEALQYAAENGLLLDTGGKAFLVMRDGELIRESRESDAISVVQFETYAFDLSQFRSVQGEMYYKPRERSTPYLMSPDEDDEFANVFPNRLLAELHDRFTAPLYVVAFALVILAWMGRPRTSRQDRSYAIAAAALICVIMRGGGFAAVAAVNSSARAWPLLYAIPLAGIVVAGAVFASGARLGVPAWLAWIVDFTAERTGRLAELASRRLSPVPEGGTR